MFCASETKARVDEQSDGRCAGERVVHPGDLILHRRFVFSLLAYFSSKTLLLQDQMDVFFPMLQGGGGGEGGRGGVTFDCARHSHHR